MTRGVDDEGQRLSTPALTPSEGRAGAMAVLLETTLGDVVIDLYTEERPRGEARPDRLWPRGRALFFTLLSPPSPRRRLVRTSGLVVPATQRLRAGLGWKSFYEDSPSPVSGAGGRVVFKCVCAVPGSVCSPHKALVALLRFAGDSSTTSLPWCVMSESR